MIIKFCLTITINNVNTIYIYIIQDYPYFSVICQNYILVLCILRSYVSANNVMFIVTQHLAVQSKGSKSLIREIHFRQVRVSKVRCIFGFKGRRIQ